MSNVLCIGDSLTAGYCHGDGGGCVYFPYANTLSELFKGEKFIDYIGYSGYTTDDVIDNQERSSCIDCFNVEHQGLLFSITAKKYDVIVLLLGTNDLGTDVRLIRIQHNIEEILKSCLEQ